MSNIYNNGLSFVPIMLRLCSFVEHNRCIFGAVQHSIICRFLSIIRSPLSSSHLIISIFTCRQASRQQTAHQHMCLKTAQVDMFHDQVLTLIEMTQIEVHRF